MSIFRQRTIQLTLGLLIIVAGIFVLDLLAYARALPYYYQKARPPHRTIKGQTRRENLPITVFLSTKRTVTIEFRAAY